MTSPPIGTDEELIERWNRTSDLEGNVSDICNAGDALAAALQSSISEVERLRALVKAAYDEGHREGWLNGDTWDDGWLMSDSYAALSQHRTTG